METKRATETVEAENSQDSSDSIELPDVPWTYTKTKKEELPTEY